MGWKWAPIGGLQYQTHMQVPKYDVQFLRSEALRSSSSSSSRTRQIKECYIERGSGLRLCLVVLLNQHALPPSMLRPLPHIGYDFSKMM